MKRRTSKKANNDGQTRITVRMPTSLARQAKLVAKEEYDDNFSHYFRHLVRKNLEAA